MSTTVRRIPYPWNHRIVTRTILVPSQPAYYTIFYGRLGVRCSIWRRIVGNESVLCVAARYASRDPWES